MTTGTHLEARVGQDLARALADLRYAIGVLVAPDHQHRSSELPQFSVCKEVVWPGSAKPHGELHVGEHRGPEAGLAHPLVDYLRRTPSGARPAARGPMTPRASVRRVVATFGDRIRAMTLAQAGRGERGKEGIAVHAGQRDGGDSERRDGGDAIRRAEGQAERPHPAEGGADDRCPLKAKRVEERGELGDGVRAERSAGVVVRRRSSPNPGRSKAISLIGLRGGASAVAHVEALMPLPCARTSGGPSPVFEDADGIPAGPRDARCRLATCCTPHAAEQPGARRARRPVVG